MVGIGVGGHGGGGGGGGGGEIFQGRIIYPGII